jgi:hypothetical protein
VAISEQADQQPFDQGLLAENSGFETGLQAAEYVV